MPRGRTFAIAAIVLLLLVAVIVGIIIWMRSSPSTPPIVPPPVNGINAGVAKPIKIPVTKPVGGAPPPQQPMRRPVNVTEPTYRVDKGKAI